MQFFLVAHRELLAAAHRRSTYRTRLAAAVMAAGAAAICFIFYLGTIGPSGLGGAMFHIVGFGCLLLAGLAGLFLTADAIASERREGTLGLLYLTQLGPFDLLVGKLIAQGTNAACATLAVFPVFSLTWILGGFTGAEVIRYLLAGLNVLFVSLAVGLAISAWVYRQGVAVGAVATILGILSLWPLLAAIPTPVSRLLAEMSPLTSLTQASALAYFSTHYWRSLALGHLTGWLFLASATVGLKRSWRTTPTASLRLADNRAARKLPADLDPALLPRRAIQALLSRGPWTLRRTWMMVSIPAVLFVIAAVFAGPRSALPLYITSSVAIGFLLKGIFAWEAVAPIAEARQDGALELLLTTPLTDRDVREAHKEHLTSTFYPPAITLYVFDWIVAGIVLGDSMPIVVMTLGGALLSILQFQAMILGGLWWGVREERTTIAFAKNFLLGTVLPIPFLWLCCSGFAVPLVLMSWLTAKLRLPLRVLLTERSPFRASVDF